MVGTVKKSIRKTLLNIDLNWVQAVPQIIYGYRRRLLAGDLSPFHLLYGVVSLLYSPYSSPLLTTPNALVSRELEIVAIQSLCADRGSPHHPKFLDDVRFSLGDKFMVAKGYMLVPLKTPARESKCIGPSNIISVHHPRNGIKSESGNEPRLLFYTLRLFIFH